MGGHRFCRMGARATASGGGRATDAGDVMDLRHAMKAVFAGVLFLLFAGEALGASANEIVAACKSVMSKALQVACRRSDNRRAAICE